MYIGGTFMSTITAEQAEELLADGAVTVSGAVKEFGIGRTRLYELMSRGELPYSSKTGRRLIPRLALRRLIAGGMVGTDELVAK
jgi:predicted DNA-binding transcriptional regulator AlpA